MRYVGELITDCRSDTGNNDYSATNGIPQSDFLRFLNWGQERLQGIVLATNPDVFQVDLIVPIVADQQAYTVNDNVYLGERIVNVEYSPTGDVKDYYKIYEEGISYRNTYPGQYPVSYHRNSGQIWLKPPSTQGSLRVRFERQLDALDLRRGQVNGTPVGAVIDLTVGSGPTVEDEALLIPNQYICISDAFGTVMLYNGVILSYVAVGDVLTLVADVDTYLVDGFTLADLANGYLTIGKWTTTHSKFPNLCERYLMAYCNWKIFGRDAATAGKRDVFEKELTGIEDEIVRSYQEPDKDEDEIQIENCELMLSGASSRGRY